MSAGSTSKCALPRPLRHTTRPRPGLVLTPIRQDQNQRPIGIHFKSFLARRQGARSDSARTAHRLHLTGFDRFETRQSGGAFGKGHCIAIQSRRPRLRRLLPIRHFRSHHFQQLVQTPMRLRRRTQLLQGRAKGEPSIPLRHQHHVRPFEPLRFKSSRAVRASHHCKHSCACSRSTSINTRPSRSV